MIFYHLSMDIGKDGVFTPRAPDDVCFFEDNMTERICVCTTVEGCLTAMPGGFLDEKMKTCNSVMKLFRIDTEKLGIPEDKILGPEKLIQDHMVPDALLTNEHWLLKGFEVPYEDISYIKINHCQKKEVSLFEAGTTKDIREVYNETETIELIEEADFSYSNQLSPVHEFFLEDKCMMFFMMDVAEGLVGKENYKVSPGKIVVDFSKDKSSIPLFYILFALYEVEDMVA